MLKRRITLIKKVLEIKNLTKRFKDRKAVDNISFDIFEGEIFGFIGPNGAGKSTAIKMITGLSKITSGDVFICGKSIKKDFRKAIKNVGAIIETPEMYNYMTGYDNLLFYSKLSPNVDKKRIMEVAELVGLKDRIKDKVKKYSMGMKQRLGIAQAILNNPKLLILDEPTNGLDAYGIIEIRNLLKGLSRNKKISILVSSHILSELEEICDTVAIIKQGKIVELKALSKLINNDSNSPKLAIKVDYPNFAGKLINEKFKFNLDVAGNEVIFSCDESSVPSILTFLVSKNISVFGMRTIKKSLEQIFLEVLNKK